MAAIAHAFDEVNTNQTTTSATYVDVSGAELTSGNFTAGKKYLLYITAQVTGPFATDLVNVRTIHGSTAFDDSQTTVRAIGNGWRYTYCWFTVWTAVASEGIKLQYSTSTTSEAHANFVSMLAMNLSDDLTENTDWVFAERTTDDGLSTTETNGAAVTITPGTASHNWLVLSYARGDSTGTTTSMISRINRSGEASSSVPSSRQEPGNTGQIFQFGMARVFTLGASSNTFTEASLTSSGTAWTRRYSAVFIMNMNKFSVNSFAYGAGPTNLSATNYATQLQTTSINPGLTTDVAIGAYWGFDQQATGREAEFRVQLDNSDQPAGQTTANYQFKTGGDATDESPFALLTMPNLTTGSKTIDLDASADSATSTPTGIQFTLWAFTMELASVATLTTEYVAPMMAQTASTMIGRRYV